MLKKYANTLTLLVILAGSSFFLACPLTTSNDASAQVLNIQIDKDNDSLLSFDTLIIKVYSKDSSFVQNVFKGKLTDPKMILGIQLDPKVGQDFKVVFLGYKNQKLAMDKELFVVGNIKSQSKDIVIKSTDSTDTIKIIGNLPEITGVQNTSIREGDSIQLQIQIIKPWSAGAKLELINIPIGATLDSNGKFFWKPTYDQGRSQPYSITLNYSLTGQKVEKTFLITVMNVNRPPKIETISDQKIQENEAFTYKIVASDPDKDSITLSAINLPIGSTLLGNIFSWKPGTETTGNYSIKFKAWDGIDSNISVMLITVGNVIPAPAVTIKITSPSHDTIVNLSPLNISYTVNGTSLQKKITLKNGVNHISIDTTILNRTAFDTIKITLDTIAPGKPIFSVQPNLYTQNKRPSWNWTKNGLEQGNGQFKFSLDSGTSNFLSNTYTYSPTSDLSEGLHVLRVQERDDAGNWSQSSSESLYVDFTNPTINITSPSTQREFVTGKTTSILSGTATDKSGIASISYSVGKVFTPTTGTINWKTETISLAENSSTIVIVKATDLAGNFSEDTITIKNDSKGPGISISQPSAIASYFTTSGSLSLTGTATDSSTIKNVTYTLTGATVSNGNAVGTSNWKIQYLTLLPGISQLKIIGFDSLDNPGTILLDITYKPNLYLVDASAKGKNTGTNWADAFTDLQSVFANNILGEVWVVKGTYKPTSTLDRNITFLTQPNVNLYGGFKGGEVTREQRDLIKNETILSGEIGSSVATDNSYHVLRAASNSTIDGFTISGGYADINATDNGKGAGIFISGFSPNFFNCIFKNNFATNAGGGVYIKNGLSQFVNCIFLENTGSGYGGGGIYVEANSSNTILNSLFIRNTTTNEGGAIVLGYACLMTIKNTLFFQNVGPYGKNIRASSTGLTISYTNADTTYDGGIFGIWNNFGNNKYRDPIFVGVTDFHLMPGSPGIDEGVDGIEIPKYDIEGGVRPKGIAVDLGPYER